MTDPSDAPTVGKYDVMYQPEKHTLKAFSSDGNELWEYDAGSTIQASPAIGSADGLFFVTRDDTVHALNADGTIRWTMDSDEDVDLYSQPVIGPDNTLYIAAKKHGDYALLAVSSDGKKLWTFTTDIINHYYSINPTIDAAGTVYLGTKDNALFAVNPDGTEKWHFDTDDGDVSSLLIDNDGILYFITDDHLFAIDTGSGGPADSPWPMYRHDPQRTNRGGKN